MKIIERIQSWYRALPDKKRYLEFFAALLTVPVLFTVLVSNVSNLQNQKKENISPTPILTSTPVPTTIIQTATPPPDQACIKEVGPIDLLYPEDGDTVMGDPVCLDIVRQGQNYCSVVWSYRINGSAWSEYTDKSICMYGLPPGTKNLELRIKSIVSTGTTTIRRTFTVAGTPTLTPTPTTASASATPTN